MKTAAAMPLSRIKWSARSRLYGAALLVTLCYLLIGRLNNDNLRWVQVDLPLSAASMLLLSLSAAEAYLYIQRLKKDQAGLMAVRMREQDLSQRLTVHRQSILNRLSRTLIDKLDLSELPAEILENIAQLFVADAVIVWESNRVAGDLAHKGSFGLTSHRADQLESIPWRFPWFEDPANQMRQFIVEDVHQDSSSSSLTRFCQNEQINTAALSPIICRNEVVGIVGLFYRQRMQISPALAAEMQTVANVIASAIQAEELYRDLVQAQKIESIGTLASGIAHDFNNVLAAILACASYVKGHTDPASPNYRYLEATESSAQRGAALTKQLLSFARREGPRVTVFNVHDCIDQTLKMLDRSFDKNILIQRQYATDLRPIEADPAQLEQVILNIAVNARDAMPDGGIFTISTRNARLSASDPYRPAVALPDGDYVVIGFRDMGCGMDAATLERIFEPFFTTKQPGKGTGLGLSMVQSIVKSFNGQMRVESAPGKGTLFEVFFPASKKPLPVVTAETPATAARGGAERILLAEDEEVIREMAQLELQAKGYKVVPAADGVSALSIYRQQWQNIDLVIADMVMPQMSGPELIGHLKQINPNVRVIVSSGYSRDQEGQRMLQHGCLGYLQKPYNAETLNKLVRSVLDSGL
jgi:signal transduction histidine kinase/ActR/RegA family two-component response regulator